MNKHYAAVAIAVICSAGLAGAQSAKNTAAAPDTGKTAKSGTLVVIGCVARSPDAKSYVLNEAIMAPRPVDKNASEHPTAAPSGDKTVLSYMLEGGEMKNHVGHKVEISGIKIAENTMAMDHKDVGGTLRVKAVKMISASCK